jgi:hypothetical protein
MRRDGDETMKFRTFPFVRLLFFIRSSFRFRRHDLFLLFKYLLLRGLSVRRRNRINTFWEATSIPRSVHITFLVMRAIRCFTNAFRNSLLIGNLGNRGLRLERGEN